MHHIRYFILVYFRFSCNLAGKTCPGLVCSFLQEVCVSLFVGADLSDYFNYGFNEDTWKAYCEKQKRLRMGLEVSTVGSVTSKITVRYHWLLVFHLSFSLPCLSANFTAFDIKFPVMEVIFHLRCSRAGQVMRRTCPVCPFLHPRQTSPCLPTSTSQESARSPGNVNICLFLDDAAKTQFSFLFKCKASVKRCRASGEV